MATLINGKVVWVVEREEDSAVGDGILRRRVILRAEVPEVVVQYHMHRRGLGFGEVERVAQERLERLASDLTGPLGFLFVAYSKSSGWQKYLERHLLK